MTRRTFAQALAAMLAAARVPRLTGGFPTGGIVTDARPAVLHDGFYRLSYEAARRMGLTPKVGESISVSTIALTAGGRVRYPASAVIGESEPEKVIPLDQCPSGDPALRIDFEAAMRSLEKRARTRNPFRLKPPATE